MAKILQLKVVEVFLQFEWGKNQDIPEVDYFLLWFADMSSEYNYIGNPYTVS